MGLSTRNVMWLIVRGANIQRASIGMHQLNKKLNEPKTKFSYCSALNFTEHGGEMFACGCGAPNDKRREGPAGRLRLGSIHSEQTVNFPAAGRRPRGRKHVGTRRRARVKVHDYAHTGGGGGCLQKNS